MDEAKAMAQQQQQQLMLQQKQQQQQQQQLLLLQQLQQQQKHHQQQQQQQQAAAIARFPSNIDVHLRPQLLQRPINPQQSHQNPNSSPKSNPHPSSSSSHPVPSTQQHLTSNQQQQQKLNRAPVNQAEIHMAYQDAWRVCHPDFKRPFSSLEDACERLLPYHVVADYEAEEDDRILDSDSTGQVLSRSQQWDNNIAAKVAEFTATFEKQVLAFNLISRKRAQGEFRSEERLMIEQALLQEERRALVEVRAEMERQKAGWDAQEANLRMAAMVQAEQARAGSQAHTEMMSRAPIQASAHRSQRNNILIDNDMGEQEQEEEPDVNPDEMINGWGNNQRDEKEPSEDFLNDEETDNGEVSMQNEWHGGGELDLNTR